MTSQQRQWVVSNVVIFLVLALGSTIQQTGSAQDTALYFFTSNACPPCRKMEPVIQSLQQKGYRVYKINVEAQPKWANHFGVTQTPTSIIVSNNLIYGRHSGMISAERLEQALSKTTQLVRAKSPAPAQPVVQQSRQSAPSGTPQIRPVSRRLTDASTENNRYVSSSGNSLKQRAHRATVRLRVEDPEGISHGTGTIVHVKDRHALVLTCGHIFRDSKGSGTISVDYGFADGKINTAQGRLLASDWNSRDVAILTFELGYPIEPAPLGGKSFLPSRGDVAFTVGCSHGKAPSIRDCQIKRTARYGLGDSREMAMKIDTTVQPVDGRSGGGLFDAEGRLIGVCNAAAQEIDEGIYTSLENVFWQLEKSRLAHLFNDSRQPGQSTRAMVSNSANSSQQEDWVITVKSVQSGQEFTIRNPSGQLLQKIASESTRESNQRLATRPIDMPDVRGIPERVKQQYRGQSPR